MKLKRLAEEIDGYDTENLTTFAPEYVTEAEQQPTLEALELVTAASMQSGLRFMKTVVDNEEKYERIVVDAEECEPAVIMNIVKDLKDSEHEYKFGSQQHSHNILAITYEYREKESE